LLMSNVGGDVGREVIRLTHFQGQSQGQGPYLLLTPYTHGVPHVDCEGPCAVTRTNPLLPPGGKAPETCPHQESNRMSNVIDTSSNMQGGARWCKVLTTSSLTPPLSLVDCYPFRTNRHQHPAPQQHLATTTYTCPQPQPQPQQAEPRPAPTADRARMGG
jgi:hypothetical protein